MAEVQGRAYMAVGILLLVLASAAASWGIVSVFNIRGAADKAAARRNAVRAAAAARTMDLRLTEPSRIGPWFFRLTGGIILTCAPILGLVGVVVLLEG
ncbi:hypothetical protein ACIQ9E_03475 [Streptomyces sp. NPDC094448]|uniref:hypothetical protein n=1 Tax=Streptomyces sp. NPDC094448 TaxID=3366063 RepID=UPI0037FAFC66